MKVTITGENVALRDQAWQKLVNEFIEKNSDIALEKLDGEEHSFEQLQEALQSLPFFSDRKMVVIRNGSANKIFTESIDKLLKEIPDTTDFILIEPKLDKRLAYYKTLKKQTDFNDYTNLDERGLARWLAETAAKQGAKLSQTDALLLVERVGLNQQLLANELDKLMLYDKAITRQTIELMTEATPQSTIFDLIEAAFNNKTARALELYEEQRALKVEPQQIIAMLAWQLHVLAIIVSADGKNLDQVSAQAKLNPYVVRRSSAVAKRLSLAKVKQLVGKLAEIDFRLKQAPIDADEALKDFILRLA